MSSTYEEHLVACGAPHGPVLEAPLSPITLWQMGSIPSVHVLPGLLDIERLKRALSQVSSLYPVIGGRLRRRLSATRKLEYFIALDQHPIKLVIATSDSPSPPFPTGEVIQPSLVPYVDQLDSATQLDNPDAPLFTVKVTNLLNTGTSVLGLCWAHILGDGDAAATFARALSKLYEGAEISNVVSPTFTPHVSLYEPSAEALSKWEIPQLFPSFPVPDAYAMYGKAGSETELVQVSFTATEVRRLKQLASGASPAEWVSEQDGLSSYWINILRLCGEPIETVVNSINYRHHFPSDPRFPPNLPTLCANVAQMHAQKLPSDYTLSLAPVALAIRGGLEALKQDPSETLEWLSCRACRMQATCDAGEMQCLVPGPTECMVNSNWRYDWNVPFGFPTGTTLFHTSFSTLNFLRVFRSNAIGADGERGAECTWRMRAGLAAKALQQISQDREYGWKRWEV